MALFKERRAERRQRVLISGATFTLRGAPGPNCAIIDQSSGGARLKFNAGQSPSFEFLLADRKTASVWKCAITWLGGGTVGARREPFVSDQ